MAKINESITTFNSLLRTLLSFCIVGLIGTAGWVGYSMYHAPGEKLAAKQTELDNANKELKLAQSEISSQKQVIAEQDIEIDRLDTAMRFLKVDHRIAELDVIDQSTVGQGDGAKKISTVVFKELNDEGNVIGEPKTFKLEGDMVYIMGQVVKFEDRYVEEADLHRSTSICLFQRIFGEFQEPSEGFQLDGVGTRPGAYARGGKMSDFEKKIWDDFWNIANDPKRARQLGIRAAHSEAPGIKVEPGAKYRILLRASDGLSLKRVDSAEISTKPGT